MSSDVRAEKCPNMLIVLDRSSSMSGTRWLAAVEAIKGFTSERQGFMRFGLLVYPTFGQLCGQGESLVHTDFYTADAISEALDRTRPNGSGTPTGDAVLFAGQQTPDMTDPERRKFVILVTDGDPTCPDMHDGEGNVQYAEQQLRALLDRGIKTFVIGVGMGASPAKLDRLAIAGGTARSNATCRDPYRAGQRIPCHFYDANDRAELSAAFDQIAKATEGEIGGRSCNDSCYRPDGCPAGQKCVKDVHDYAGGKFQMNHGKCVADLCHNVRCGADEYCRDGVCIRACTTPCPGATVCRDGACVDDPCANGGCACASPCPRNLECIEGSCEDNACRYMTCPDSAPFCDKGHCYAPSVAGMDESRPFSDLGQVQDAPRKRLVDNDGQFENNPGGCSCGDGSMATLGLMLLAFIGTRAVRRRR
ncbi:MAG: vWA domain-containing protein [Myxococcales bacterium]